MDERQIDIATPSGRMSTFMCHPPGRGPHPIVMFFMDAPGMREELRDMARRLAGAGYYVLLPNLYYREGVDEIGPFAGPGNEATRTRMFALMETLSIASVMDDADALLAFADSDPAASRGPLGCVGYCMSGPYALAAATRHPDRVAAAASIYGTRLVTAAPDSPHLTAPHVRAELYIGCAEFDDYVPLEMVEAMRQALEAGHAKAQVELYSGVHHGFAFPQRAAYDRDAAERHWDRLFALLGRNLSAASQNARALKARP